jgi:hypothetical protein
VRAAVRSAVTYPERVRRTMSVMSSTLRAHLRRPLGSDLDTDWLLLARRERSLPLDAMLAAAGRRPRDGDRAPLAEPVDEDTADRCLADLVRRAADDALAARVVLQRLLPGLVAIARRRARGDRLAAHDAFDELVGAGWLVIRVFPIERRPARVAANLLRDIEYQAFVAPARRRRVATEPLDGWAPDSSPARPPADSAFDEVVALLSHARAAGCPVDDLAFVAALLNGRSLEDLATERGVTLRAERYHRARVARRLRHLCIDDEPDVAA